MATIKSFSSLEQSRKLAKFLPLESADMRYDEYTSHIDGTPKVGYKKGITEGISCWSLATLLGVLPDCPDLSKHTDNKWYITTYPNGVHTCLMGFDNPVDACVAMIIRLNELNLL